MITEKGIWPDWYVDYIEVHCHGKSFFFSIYEWVENDFAVIEGCAKLVDDSKVLSRFNEMNLKKQCKTYQWYKTSEMPYPLTGHLAADTYKDLPQNCRWSKGRDKEINDFKAIGTFNIVGNKCAGAFKKFNKLEDIKRLLILPSMKHRKVLEPCWFNWKDDREFARQHINGSRYAKV